jgi:NADH:ubiquinone reductase (H+-translocating)
MEVDMAHGVLPPVALPTERARVVVIGAGFGGLSAAKALRRAPVEVTIVDQTNHHLFQPLLYQVSTGILSEGDIAPPIRDVLRHQSNTRVVLGRVVGFDLGTRKVLVEFLGRTYEIPYDSLIVAAGSTKSYFGNDQFATYAPGMKTIDDALELRSWIFGAFEAAEIEADRDRQQALLTFAVIGAGPTGVELAGQIAELSRRALKKNFRVADPTSAHVVLLDSVDTVLPTFPESLRRRASRDLERLGVDLRLGTRVTGIDSEGLDVATHEGSLGRLDARTKIWAAGVQASGLGRILAEQCEAQVDKGGRVVVLPDCTLPGHPEVFVVGDLMSLDDLPGVAEVAMQSGRYAARAIVRRVKGRGDDRPFHYRDLGTMATISRFRAVAYWGPIRLSGFVGWWAWLAVHLVFLTGFKNRVSALANWTVAFVGRARRQRAFTAQQVFARERVPGHVGEATDRQ